MYISMDFNHVITFLIVGGLAGWIASVLVKGSGFGVLGDIVVGVIGAFVGAVLASVFNIAVYGFLGVLGMSILGAVIFLLILRACSPRRNLS